MPLTLMLIPADEDLDLTKISLGLVNAFSKQGIRGNFFQPISQGTNNHQNVDIHHSISISKVLQILGQGRFQDLLEDISAMHKNITQQADVTVVSGLFTRNHPYTSIINLAIADALSAKIIVVMNVENRKFSEIDSLIGAALNIFQAGRIKNRIAGCILNKTNYIPNTIAHNTDFIACIPDEQKSLTPETYIDLVAEQIDPNWIINIVSQSQHILSSSLFRYQLIKRARQAKKTIVLPEGEELRIIKAAIICSKRKLAKCILLGDLSNIQEIARANNLDLPATLSVIDPKNIVEKYIEPMVEIRKSKGLTIAVARKNLQDPTILATMMLALQEVDGVVGGATHLTADTIRPAFQLIGTRPDIKFVSSVFFICLPEQVLVYGDCAVNANPNAEELAAIAIASADSAKMFGIEPVVAMISYVTGNSVDRPEIEKVKLATALVRKQRPDILIDGPLQYDAAIDETVAKIKAPDSKVAGKATVFIFPNLEAGNAIYKAVQRSANVLSIGPMLQGLKKPVNDLSRGALVEDIVFTIALTAIQASSNSEK